MNDTAKKNRFGMIVSACCGLSAFCGLSLVALRELGVVDVSLCVCVYFVCVPPIAFGIGAFVFACMAAIDACFEAQRTVQWRAQHDRRRIAKAGRKKRAHAKPPKNPPRVPSTRNEPNNNGRSQ